MGCLDASEDQGDKAHRNERLARKCGLRGKKAKEKHSEEARPSASVHWVEGQGRDRPSSLCGTA